MPRYFLLFFSLFRFSMRAQAPRRRDATFRCHFRQRDAIISAFDIFAAAAADYFSLSSVYAAMHACHERVLRATLFTLS